MVWESGATLSYFKDAWSSSYRESGGDCIGDKERMSSIGLFYKIYTAPYELSALQDNENECKIHTLCLPPPRLNLKTRSACVTDLFLITADIRTTVCILTSVALLPFWDVAEHSWKAAHQKKKLNRHQFLSSSSGAKVDLSLQCTAFAEIKRQHRCCVRTRSPVSLSIHSHRRTQMIHMHTAHHSEIHTPIFFMLYALSNMLLSYYMYSCQMKCQRHSVSLGYW